MDTAGIEPYQSLPHLYDAAADAFCHQVRQRAEQAGVVRLCLSGGSTPRRLYELLAQRDLPWDKVHWFWGDERNVPRQHQDSNFNMVRQAILEPIDAPPENVHPVPVELGDPVLVASDYERTLREHFPADTFPTWDLVLLGMGDDAHTASLFPHTGALQATDRWFVENWVPKFDGYRYTLTAPAINSGDQIWFLVAGSGKREALAQVLSPDRRPQSIPAQLIEPTRWFVTQDAVA
jgi:6-phosphogluconolactonase